MIGISPTLDESVSARLQDIAQRNDIAYQLEVMGGRTGRTPMNCRSPVRAQSAACFPSPCAICTVALN